MKSDHESELTGRRTAHPLRFSLPQNPRRLSDENTPFLRSAEVSSWLGVSQRTVCLWAELDEIPAFKLGHQWRFREAALRKWLEGRQSRPIGT